MYFILNIFLSFFFAVIGKDENLSKGDIFINFSFLLLNFCKYSWNIWLCRKGPTAGTRNGPRSGLLFYSHQSCQTGNTWRNIHLGVRHFLGVWLLSCCFSRCYLSGNFSVNGNSLWLPSLYTPSCGQSVDLFWWQLDLWGSLYLYLWIGAVHYWCHAF